MIFEPARAVEQKLQLNVRWPTAVLSISSNKTELFLFGSTYQILRVRGLNVSRDVRRQPEGGRETWSSAAVSRVQSRPTKQTIFHQVRSTQHPKPRNPRYWVLPSPVVRYAQGFLRLDYGTWSE